MPKAQKITKPSFKSYVKPNGTTIDGASAEGQFEGVDKLGPISAEDLGLTMSEVSEKTFNELEPDLHPGELVVSMAARVVRFMPYSDMKSGIIGRLCVTNFRIIFIPISQSSREHIPYASQRNKLVGSDDIVLAAVDVIFQVSKNKRKRLSGSRSVTGGIKKVEIHCKDFRIHNFSFKFSSKDVTKQTIIAMVHYAFPTTLDLHFAFFYQGNTMSAANQGARVPQYNQPADWEAELKRLNSKSFRVTDVNDSFNISADSLPACFVVPSDLTNQEIVKVAPQYGEYRCPVWSYSHSNGCSLIRMASPIPEASNIKLQERMLEAIQMANPSKSKYEVYLLSSLLPSTRDIRSSYDKLKELCMPATCKEVKDSDGGWFSSLDGTKWLHLVSDCLKVASRAAGKIHDTSVILQETNGSDLSPLVACVVQLILDPYCRTLQGFQKLVEREWVAMGHKFTYRYGLLQNQDSDEQSPVFLLYLDCVWQLLQQFPSAFQISEVYLTTLWDCVCMGMFRNFLFCSPREYRQMTLQSRELMSVWDWSAQFSDEDKSLFNNPLYTARTELECERKINAAKSHNSMGGSRTGGSNAAVLRNKTSEDEELHTYYTKKLSGVFEELPDIMRKNPTELQPVVKAPLLKFWSHCYLRWLTPLQIQAGGTPSEYLQQCILVEEILCLQHKVRSMETSTPFIKSARPKSDLIFSYSRSNITPNRNHWSDCVTSSFPFTPGHPPNQASFFGTSISMLMDNSMVADTDEPEEAEESLDELEASITSTDNLK